MASLSKQPMLLWSTTPSEPPRINSAFSDEYGLTLQDLVSKPLLEWVHPNDRQALQHILETGEGEVLARLLTKQEDWRMLCWRVRTDAGRVVALALPQRTDETELKIPKSLSPQKSTLTETLERMARIVESKADECRCSILLVETDGAHVSVGAGPSLPHEYNCAVQGLRIGPTVGSCGTAAFWNVPVVVENIDKDPLWKDLRQAAKLAGVASCWSVPITGATGEEVLGAMALYKNEPGAPGPHDMELLEIAARMVGLAIERDRLEEQLREATKAEAIGVLAGGIAHDFNNLMAIVMGNAEMASLSLPQASPIRENLERIVSTSAAASDLCKQLLAYAGRGSSVKETLDCNLMVKELTDLIVAGLSKKVSLTFEIDHSPCSIVADRSHLRQVFMNLMTNASDAIGYNKGRIIVGTKSVSLSHEDIQRLQSQPTLSPGEYVCVWVSDTGMGMSPETKAKIFDPFFTTKSDGHGLGLAAVSGIVKSHKGAISIDTALNIGTTFSVWLPRVSSTPEPEVVTSTTQGVPEGTRILVAEDHASVRMVAVDILQSAGYTVVEAKDGQEAVDVFRRDPDAFDCVLLDHNMPKMDGEEVLKELKKIRSDIRVVLNSGFTKDEIVARFKGSDLADIIHKPTPRNVLLNKIEKAVVNS